MQSKNLVNLALMQMRKQRKEAIQQARYEAAEKNDE